MTWLFHWWSVPLAGSVAVIVILVCLPPDYDPAIRFKEWTERWRR